MACCCELQNTLDVEVTQDALLDVEIGGSAGVLLQAKSVEVTENGTSVVVPDEGFDGLKIVEINTNTPENITGVPEAEDGISIAQLLGSTSAYSSVTEIVDTNVGWTMGRDGFIEKLVSLFPNIKDITLSCVDAKILISNPAINIHPLNLPYLEHTTTPKDVFINGMEEWYLPKIKSFDYMTATDVQTANLKKMNFPDLESVGKGISYPNFFGLTPFPNLEEMYFPSLKYIHTWGTAREISTVGETTKFWKLVLGKLEYLDAWRGGVRRVDFIQSADTHLVHVEIGAGTAISFSISGWNPTYALQNQLRLFLSNFKTYIAERLTDKGSGLTLTLSQAVRDAIQQDPEIVSIITGKGWTISPAPSV